MVSGVINQIPFFFLEIQWFGVMEHSVLIFRPVTCRVVIEINTLRVVELFRLNSSELIIYLEFPV